MTDTTSPLPHPAPYVSGDQQASQPPHGSMGQPHHQQGERIPFSYEELQALKECNRESFWYRCVPLSVVFVGATQYAVRTGYLQSKGKFGGIGRNIAAVVAGFIMGKLSYQSECRKKIMAIPNSRLAESMRNKGKAAPEVFSDMSGFEAPSSTSVDTQGLQSDYNPSLDLDPDRRVHHAQPEGLDDTYRPNLDNSALPADTREPTKSYTNYDDLRKQNRENHDKRVMDSVLRRSTQPPPSSVPPGAPPLQPPPPPVSSSSYQSSISSPSRMRDEPDQPSQPTARKHRNKYGDAIE